LGEQIANELVDWFNAVDTTYREDLPSWGSAWQCLNPNWSSG